MGIFSKGDKVRECVKNPEDGSIHCESFRQRPDGSRVPLASMDIEADGSCQPVVTGSHEDVEGEYQDLEKWALPRVKGGCQRGRKNATQPQDY